MAMAFRTFSEAEHGTWKMLYAKQTPLRNQQVFHIFSEGLEKLKFSTDRIPHLDVINPRLEKLTGFNAIPVKGLVEDRGFLKLLSEKRFPIGNFIREAQDLAYTPEPDVFHDLYGHIPFLANKDYANFSYELGKFAMTYADNPAAISQLSSFYWFTVEFPLIKIPDGKRIFGAGIASSFGECAYALSNEPDVRPFDIDEIRRRPYRIDEFQKVLFILENEAQLYGCLPELKAKMEKDFGKPN